MFKNDVYLDGVLLQYYGAFEAFLDRPASVAFRIILEGEALTKNDLPRDRVFLVDAPVTRWDVREEFRRTTYGRQWQNGKIL